MTVLGNTDLERIVPLLHECQPDAWIGHTQFDTCLASGMSVWLQGWPFCEEFL